jgi:flagellar hook-length control protein FliK
VLTFAAQNDAKGKSDPAISTAESTPILPTPTNPIAQLPVHATEKLHARVGTPAWETALGQKVCWMIGDQQQTASLTLNPPDLGPLQVVLTINNDQASAAFFASEPEVRRAIESAIPRLREMMDAAGIRLGDATVGAGTSGYGSSSSDAGNLAGTDAGSSRDQGKIDVVDQKTVRAVVRGLVDTFA